MSETDAATQAALLLASHPEHRWTLTDLAQRVHLSRSQLERVFGDRFGRSPMSFLMRVRARRLAHLLVTTDLPIGDAMAQVGWHSRGHAARQFKALTGETPSEFRAARASQGRTPTGGVRQGSAP